MPNLTDTAKVALKDSRSVARERGAAAADTVDIFVAAIRTSDDVQRALGGLGIDWHRLTDIDPAETQSGRRPLLRKPVGFTMEARTLLLQASTLVAGGGEVSASHLVSAALGQDDERIGERLAACGASTEDVRRALES